MTASPDPTDRRPAADDATPWAAERLRQRHAPCPCGNLHPTHCVSEGIAEGYPCDTALVLDALAIAPPAATVADVPREWLDAFDAHAVESADTHQEFGPGPCCFDAGARWQAAATVAAPPAQGAMEEAWSAHRYDVVGNVAVTKGAHWPRECFIAGWQAARDAGAGENDG